MKILSNNSMKILVFIVLLLFYIINLSFCQILNSLSIGNTIKSELKIDESFEYFWLSIPINESNKILIFSFHEENEEIDNNEKMFSGLDIYISKINKYPSSKSTSEWYSNKFVSDIVSIPPESVNAGDIFYIGLYCQFKCKYKLNVYTSNEIDISVGQYYSLNINPQESMSYKLYIDKDFEELKIIAYSKSSGKFRIFMSKNSPSSQNTFDIIPSWINGYAFSVKQKDLENYCTKCYYHILIQNHGIESINSLIFYSYFREKILNLSSGIILYDFLDNFSKSCYSFRMTNLEKKKEQLIIHTILYSGDFSLILEGWEPKKIEGKEAFVNQEYIYKVFHDNYIILKKNDFEKFNKDNPEFSDKDSSLNFCIFSASKTSFTLSIYYLTKLQELQETDSFINILTPGNHIRNYLLKNQLIKYELIGYNIEKNKYNLKTNVTITTSKIVGNILTYGYFCKEEKCIIKRNDIEKLSKEKKLINSQLEDFETLTLEIPYQNNECLQNPKIKLLNNNTINCLSFVIVYCETPNLDGLCIYDIQLSINDIPLLMQPKEIYYGTISLGKEDSYEISISDSNIHSIIVVLDSESGNSELLFFRKKGNTSNQENISLIKGSFNNNYIPEVIRITPSLVGEENLIGNYLVKVIAKSFSSYHIYYYVTYNKDINEKKRKEKMPEVSMNIDIGEVITDYFPREIKYKIYTFTTLLEKKDNIKIFINRVNVDLKIYLYRNLTNFSFEKFYEKSSEDENKEIILGYDLKSNLNNEIIITKNDPRYTLNQLYYLVIIPNLPKAIESDIKQYKYSDNDTNLGMNETINEKATIKFYLGISTENSPISINEGIPHSFTLNSNYNSQKYFYVHTDINKNFELEINVLSGAIDIYIDIRDFEPSQIEKINKDKFGNESLSSNFFDTLHYKMNVVSNDIISINSEFFKKYFKSSSFKIRELNLYFYIQRSKKSVNENENCQYLLIEKSTETKGELLQPGLIRTSKLKVGKRDHYIIEEVKKRKGGIINVNFKNGYGHAYVRIPKIPESKNIIFPSAENYDYIGKDINGGKIIIIPEEVYNKLDSKNIKLQFLVTVEAEYDSNAGLKEFNTLLSEAIYTISYSNEPKKLNQNSPYDGYITKGELQYFTFFFDETAENIFIGLNNMNGNADMYLNYGSIIPSLHLSDWKSLESNVHKFINFNIKDNFFVRNHKKSLAGFYTLLIVGFTETSYTLFISNHKNKVIPLRNNKPMTCTCGNENDKCYFIFDDVLEFDSDKKVIQKSEIIFTTQYFYGDGIMYSKIFSGKELYGKEFYKLFPNSNNYEVSNEKGKQRNYMKMEIEREKYSKDSNILLSFICLEKTEVVVTATTLRHFKSVDFLAENRENVYYLDYNEHNLEQPELDIYFYNIYKNQDFIYNFHSYIGEAHIEVFSNASSWSIDKQEYLSDYHLYNKFDLKSLIYDKENIDIYNPFSQDYHNFISKMEKKEYNLIIFRIKPKSKFGFYIQGNFDKSWVKLPIGKTKNYFAKNNRLYGYFDISDEYSDIEFNLNLDNNLIMSAELFIKINIIDINRKIISRRNETLNEFELYHYSLPNQNNCDYSAKTDSTLGTISININNLPKIKDEERNSKFIRGLFLVKINKEEFQYFHDEEEFDENNIQNNSNKGIRNEQQLITILIIPGVNDFKYVEANPYEYYFSNLTYDKEKNGRVPETKIYSLTRERTDHDLMIIEISSCNGEYEIEVQESSMIKNKSYGILDYYETKRYGKHSIYIENLKEKHYFLKIKEKPTNIICSLNNQGKLKSDNCGYQLSYLMYYFTCYKKDLELLKIDRAFSYKPYGLGKIKIDLPKTITNEINNRKKDIKDFKFDVFVMKGEKNYYKMDSICFLSRFQANDSTISNYKDVRTRNKTSLIVSGLGYRKRYYINIMAQNLKTKELISFHPFPIRSGGYLPFPFWAMFEVVTLSIALIFFIIIYIRKYKKVKKELKVIKGEALPKTEAEVSQIEKSERIYYSGLGDNY